MTRIVRRPSGPDVVRRAAPPRASSSVVGVEVLGDEEPDRARSAIGNRSTRSSWAGPWPPRAGAPARGRARSRAPRPERPRARDDTRIDRSSGVHEPHRWTCWSDHLTSTRAREAVLAGEAAGAGGDVDPRRVDPAPHALGELLGDICRPRPATSNAGTTPETGRRPAPLRRACGDGFPERARSPCPVRIPVGDDGLRTRSLQVIEHSGPDSGASASGPAQLVEAVVVDAEVVREFVHERDPDLGVELVLVGAGGRERQAEQRDLVGQERRVDPRSVSATPS